MFRVGRKFTGAYDCSEGAVRDLPLSAFRCTVHVEVFRVKCPDCRVKIEKVPLLPGKAPFSKRFEDAVAQACEFRSSSANANRPPSPVWRSPEPATTWANTGARWSKRDDPACSVRGAGFPFEHSDLLPQREEFQGSVQAAPEEDADGCDKCGDQIEH